MLESNDGPGAALEVAKEQASVLLVASEHAPCAAAIEALTAGGIRCWTARDRAAAVSAASAHQPEVAVVELGFHACDGLGVAVQLAAAAPHLQAIFFADRGGEGEIAAAQALGLERVFLMDELAGALGRLLGPLAEQVRLRRRLEQVEELLRRLSMNHAGPSLRGRITLFEGERRYRETYVRALLAETGNRREAARRAGVPYTTLCDMIRKLGIANEAEARTEVRIGG